MLLCVRMAKKTALVRCILYRGLSNAAQASKNWSLDDFEELRTAFAKLPEVHFTALKIGAHGCSIGRQNYNSFTGGNIDLELFTPEMGKDFAVSTKLTTLYRDAVSKITSQKVEHSQEAYDVAVKTLLSYLGNIDFHETCIKKGIEKVYNDAAIRPEFFLRSHNSKLSETNIATLLAVHLLSKLTANGNGLTYVLSNDFNNKPHVCPCSCQDCGEKLTYASTLIGSVDLFIGKPDIVLFPYNKDRMIGIMYPQNSSFLDKRDVNRFVDQSEKHFVEDPLEKWTTFEQVALQTITFSFYHRIFNERQIELTKDDDIDTACLIPTIAICDKGFRICMYDSVNDIFIHSHGPPIPLFDVTGECLRKTSVIYLWMIINHSLFKPTFTETYLSKMRGSFGLFSRFINEDFYGRIKDTMDMNIEIVTKNKLKSWRKTKLTDPDDPDV